jgi:hypothetical protein
MLHRVIQIIRHNGGVTLCMVLGLGGDERVEYCCSGVIGKIIAEGGAGGVKGGLECMSDSVSNKLSA